MCSFSFSSSSSSSISLSFSPKSEALTSLLAPAACFESSCHLKSSLCGFKIPLGSQDSVIAAGLESFPVAEPLILRMLKGSGKRGIVASPFRCFFWWFDTHFERRTSRDCQSAKIMAGEWLCAGSTYANMMSGCTCGRCLCHRPTSWSCWSTCSTVSTTCSDADCTRQCTAQLGRALRSIVQHGRKRCPAVHYLLLWILSVDRCSWVRWAHSCRAHVAWEGRHRSSTITIKRLLRLLRQGCHSRDGRRWQAWWCQQSRFYLLTRRDGSLCWTTSLSNLYGRVFLFFCSDQEPLKEMTTLIEARSQSSLVTRSKLLPVRPLGNSKTPWRQSGVNLLRRSLCKWTMEKRGFLVVSWSIFWASKLQFMQSKWGFCKIL